MLTDVAGKLAGALALAAYVPYVIAILRKETRPSRASWFIWAIMAVLLVVSSFSAGARDTLWVAVSFTIGAVTVAILALKYGIRVWTRLDTVCSLCAGTGIALLVISRSPLPTLLLSIAVMLFGAMPTLRKTLHNPSEENRAAWALFGLSCVVNLFAVEKWEFVIWSFPVAALLFDGTMAALVLWPRKKNAVCPNRTQAAD